MIRQVTLGYLIYWWTLLLLITKSWAKG